MFYWKKENNMTTETEILFKNIRLIENFGDSLIIIQNQTVDDISADLVNWIRKGTMSVKPLEFSAEYYCYNIYQRDKKYPEFIKLGKYKPDYIPTTIISYALYDSKKRLWVRPGDVKNIEYWLDIYNY